MPSVNESNKREFTRGKSLASFGAWGRRDTVRAQPVVQTPAANQPGPDAGGHWQAMNVNPNVPPTSPPPSDKHKTFKHLFPNVTFFNETGRLLTHNAEDKLLQSQSW
jgi:hypothetical protein